MRTCSRLHWLLSSLKSCRNKACLLQVCCVRVCHSHVRVCHLCARNRARRIVFFGFIFYRRGSIFYRHPVLFVCCLCRFCLSCFLSSLVRKCVGHSCSLNINVFSVRMCKAARWESKRGKVRKRRVGKRREGKRREGK